MTDQTRHQPPHAHAHAASTERPPPRSQFGLLGQRRFAPYVLVQLLGAFNDNVFRQAIIGLLGVMVVAGAMDNSTRGIYTQLAPAVGRPRLFL